MTIFREEIMKLSSFIALAAAGILLVSSPVLAGGVYFGGGFHSASFGEDLARNKYVDIRPNMGYVLNAGILFSDFLGIDFKYGYTDQREAISNTPVHLTSLETGPIIFFMPEAAYRPYVTAGIGSYEVDTTGLDLKGDGVFYGVGIQEFGSKHHTGKFYLQESRWTDDDLDADVSAFSIGAVYNYRF
jgi:hypothetical protein